MVRGNQSSGKVQGFMTENGGRFRFNFTVVYVGHLTVIQMVHHSISHSHYDRHKTN